MKTRSITLNIPTFEGCKTLIFNAILMVTGAMVMGGAVPKIATWIAAQPGLALMMIGGAGVMLRILTVTPMIGLGGDDVETPREWGVPITAEEIAARARDPEYHMAIESERTHRYNSIPAYALAGGATGFLATWGAILAYTHV